MMQHLENAITHHTDRRPILLTAIVRAFLWVATWPERNLPAGDDGKHIPDSVRRIIDTRNFYI